MKRLFALSSVPALALLLAAVPAMASTVDVSGDNTLTGPNSSNENDYDIDHDGDQTLSNTGVVTNSASVTASTGGNDQSENTEGGDLDTGDVAGGTDWEATVNAAAAMAGMDGDLDVMGDFSNDTTGPDSENDNDLDVDADQSLALTNFATVLNALGLSAVTGDNEQTENTTAGDLMSGDVRLDATARSWANTGNLANGVGSHSVTVDVSGTNDTTGPNSDNDNDFDIDSDATTTITNSSTTTNSVGVSANTGGNVQNQNTTGGNVRSGDVDVSTDIRTRANTGGSTGGSHSVNVDADFSNDTTGPNSENDNDLDVDSDSTTTVTNTATVTNSTSVNANTGDNEQSQNTTGGDVDTGDVTFDFNVESTVN